MLFRTNAMSLAVSQIISQSAQAKQMIVGAEGTPLHELASACVGLYSISNKLDDKNFVGSAEESFNNVVSDSRHHDMRVLRQSVEEDKTVTHEASAHTVKYAGIAAQISEVIKRNLPIAEEAGERISGAFDEIKGLFGTSDRVIPIRITQLVGGDLVNEGLLANYAKSKMRDGDDAPNTEINPVYTAVENIDDFPVAELIKTGINSLDEQLKDWAVKGGAKLVFEVFNRLYVKSRSDDVLKFTKRDFADFTQSDTLLDVCIALMLLSLNAEEVGLNYANTETSIEEIEYGHKVTLSFACAVICEEIEDVIAGRSRGKVVYKYPVVLSAGSDWNNEVYEIVVDGVAYEDFLNSGGSVDLIYGSYLTSHTFTKDDLLASSESFLTAWKDGEARLRRERTQGEITRIHAAVRGRLFRDFNALPTEHRNSITSDQIAFELDRFNKHLTPENITHLYDQVRELYCAVMYPGTEVACLLRCIDEVKADESASKDSVLRLAITEYTAKWLMQQAVSTEYHHVNVEAGNNAFTGWVDREFDLDQFESGLNSLFTEQENLEKAMVHLERIQSTGLVCKNDIVQIQNLAPGLLSDGYGLGVNLDDYSVEPSSQGLEAGLNGEGGGIFKLILKIIGAMVLLFSGFIAACLKARKYRDKKALEKAVGSMSEHEDSLHENLRIIKSKNFTQENIGESGNKIGSLIQKLIKTTDFATGKSSYSLGEWLKDPIAPHVIWIKYDGINHERVFASCLPFDASGGLRKFISDNENFIKKFKNESAALFSALDKMDNDLAKSGKVSGQLNVSSYFKDKSVDKELDALTLSVGNAVYLPNIDPLPEELSKLYDKRLKEVLDRKIPFKASDIIQVADTVSNAIGSYISHLEDLKKQTDRVHTELEKMNPRLQKIDKFDATSAKEINSMKTALSNMSAASLRYIKVAKNVAGLESALCEGPIIAYFELMAAIETLAKSESK